METFYQILAIILLFFDCISGLWLCIEGQKAKKPCGIEGTVVFTIGIVLVVFIFIKAGTFDKLF